MFYVEGNKTCLYVENASSLPGVGRVSQSDGRVRSTTGRYEQTSTPSDLAKLGLVPPTLVGQQKKICTFVFMSKTKIFCISVRITTEIYTNIAAIS